MKKTKSKYEQNQKLVAEKNVLCLLIRVNEPVVTRKGEVTDNIRHFFTARKNRRYLVEFSKAFGAELLDVKAKEAVLLPLSQLTEAFCDSTYNATSEFEIITNKTPQPHRPKKTIPKKGRICKQIRNRLLTGKPLSTQELYSRLQSHGLSDTTIRHYYTTVRAELEDEGYDITHIKRGEYQVD